jgi:hypothetical protein
MLYIYLIVGSLLAYISLATVDKYNQTSPIPEANRIAVVVIGFLIGVSITGFIHFLMYLFGLGVGVVG